MVLQCVGWKLHIAPLAKDHMFFSKTILLWTAPKSRRSWVSRNFSTVDVWSQEVGAGSSWVEFSTTWDLRWCSHCRPNSIIAARPNCWKRSRRRTRRVPVREQLLLPKLGLRTSSQKKSIEKSWKVSKRKNVLFVVPSFHYLVPSPSFPFFPLLSSRFLVSVPGLSVPAGRQDRGGREVQNQFSGAESNRLCSRWDFSRYQGHSWSFKI